MIFIAQYVYHSVFNNYLSVIGTIKFGNQAVDNADTVISNIKAQIVDVILLAVPVLIMIVCIWTFMAFDRRRWWVNLIGAAGTASGVCHNTVCDVGCGLGCVQSVQFIQGIYIG